MLGLWLQDGLCGASAEVGVYVRVWQGVIVVLVCVGHSTRQSIYTNCKCHIHLSKFKLWAPLRPQPLRCRCLRLSCGSLPGFCCSCSCQCCCCRCCCHEKLFIVICCPRTELDTHPREADRAGVAKKEEISLNASQLFRPPTSAIRPREVPKITVENKFCKLLSCKL